MKIDEWDGWTRYHIIHTTKNQWKFYREGMKRSITTRKDRNKVIQVALSKVAKDGGVLTVHSKDGSVDFLWIIGVNQFVGKFVKVVKNENNKS